MCAIMGVSEKNYRVFGTFLHLNNNYNDNICNNIPVFF